MSNFTETTTLRDVIVTPDGKVVAAYDYALHKDGAKTITDVKYVRYEPGDAMTDEIYALLTTASQKPAAQGAA